MIVVPNDRALRALERPCAEIRCDSREEQRAGGPGFGEIGVVAHVCDGPYPSACLCGRGYGREYRTADWSALLNRCARWGIQIRRVRAGHSDIRQSSMPCALPADPSYPL